MARCENCGNDYDKPFEVLMDGQRHVFDSFECAVHVLAPTCDHCGCKILGHGVEVNGSFFCWAHCAGEPIKPYPYQSFLRSTLDAG